MKIELNLLDIGLYFILDVIKKTTRFRTHDNLDSAYKYAVLNVFSGIQLILKDRLKKEHWSLIFEDVSNAKESKFEDGDFVSVNHINIIKRLKGICNISFNGEPINELRKLRNKFEHFEVKVEIQECKELIANSVRELIIFWDTNISDYSNEGQNQKFGLIKSLAFDFETYTQNMLNKNRDKINGLIKSNSGILVHCKHCSNKSLMIYKNKNFKYECFVCETKYSKIGYEKLIRESEKDGSLFKFEKYNYNCEHCNKQSRIRIKPSNTNSGEYQSDYFFCVECLHNETQSEINSRELEKELRELEKNHTHEEFIEILKSRIIEIEEEE